MYENSFGDFHTSNPPNNKVTLFDTQETWPGVESPEGRSLWSFLAQRSRRRLAPALHKATHRNGFRCTFHFERFQAGQGREWLRGGQGFEGFKGFEGLEVWLGKVSILCILSLQSSVEAY